MSYDAIKWALAQPVPKSSAKFVLVAMANCVNGDVKEMLCWPSTQHLADATAQDRKTVMDNVKRLREAGYIEDTNERKGMTGQVPVYRLKTPEIGTVATEPLPTIEPPPSETNGAENGTDSETVPKTVTVPKTDAKGPAFPYEESQFSLSTVPKTGQGTRREPVKNQEGTRKVEPPAPVLPGVPSKLLDDYLKVRRAKRAGPLTETAIKGLVREAAKAGISLEQAVTACCEFGWQGFNAGWYAERMAKNAGARPATPYQSQRAARMAEAVPALVSHRQDDGLTLDAETSHVPTVALG